MLLQIKLLLLCFVTGIFQTKNVIAKPETKSTSKEILEKSVPMVATADNTAAAVDATKDKRELTSKETQIYPNHRTEAEVIDDPEDGQETIYGPKPNQFLIRPISPHQHQQHEEHQQQPQLRNYPATIRPISQQLLEQSQEVQHYAYLHELSRTQPAKSVAAVAAAAQLQGKTKASAQHKKIARPTTTAYSTTATTANEEAEQRYAYAVQPQIPQHLAPQPQPQLRHFHPSPRYHITAAPPPPPPPSQQHQQLLQSQPQAQQQEPQQHQQQQYQIIPEEQFLKLIEEELQARAYHDAQIQKQQQQQQQQQQHHHHQQQQQQHHHHQQQQHQHQQAQSQTDASNKVEQQIAAAERSGPSGLGNYRQRIAVEPPTAADEYIQYIRPRQRAGPKYLPEPPEAQADPAGETPAPPPPPPQPLPQHLAFYPQPQINYKTLSNHPLAKSSLEKEIENLIAANKHAASLQLVDSTNEPSAVVNQHRQPPPHYQPRQLIHQQQKQASVFVSSTTPNSLVDANNQPFIPSLFRFSQYQTPTPIYPTQQSIPQQIIDAKKLGPVVYPTTAPSAPAPTGPPQPQPQPQQQQPQPNLQYYHYNHEPAPSPRPYRSKQYGLKISTPTPHIQSNREKEAKLQLQYTQPLVYDYEHQGPPQAQAAAAGGPAQFYPSPKDPNPTAPAAPRPTLPVPLHAEPPPANFRQYVLPAAAPSQSSIYVSQGTGITTPSRPIHRATTSKPKTAEDVKQLHLPQPGGKPLTQAEFQALVDAGYPVTAVPVPVPVPYEQYIKDHPEHRNQPVDYPLTRFAQQYPTHHQHQPHQYRNFAAPSEPAVKIVSSPSEPKVATAIGGGAVTYLRPIVHGQQRRPRDEQKATAVEGKKEAA